MKLHQKINYWVIDYLHMLKGGLAMVVYHRPPKHYLEYILPGKAPVILIPGILGKWSFMKHLGDRISLTGHPVYIVPQLKYNVYSIPSSARKVRTVIVHAIPKFGHILPHLPLGSELIRNFIERHNIKGGVLVAHSKGGLIGKYLLAHYNQDQRIKGMVAIATPFSGSRLAKLIPHKAFKELATESKIIHALEAHQAVNHRIISIIPEFDNHVWAERGSYLEGAENIQVNIGGHHKVLFDKKVEDEVIKDIERISNQNSG